MSEECYNLKVIKRYPIAMYGARKSMFKRIVIRSNTALMKYVRVADKHSGYCAVVINAEWYEENREYIKTVIALYLPHWSACEIYRDLVDWSIVVVVALKPNKKTSSRINKRIVDRAYKCNRNMTCAYTKEPLDRKEASAEHIIPLSNGGNNSVWNICVATCSLNNNRGNMDYWEYWRRLLCA